MEALNKHKNNGENDNLYLNNNDNIKDIIFYDYGVTDKKRNITLFQSSA